MEEFCDDDSTVIVRIALFNRLEKLLDYLPPLDDPKPICIGMRVLVPFRQEQKVGIVVALLEQSECALEKLKPIEAILDSQPLITNKLLSLIEWTAQYYQASLSTVFSAALPAALKKIPKTSAARKKSFSACDSRTSIPVFDDSPSLESTPLVGMQKNFLDQALVGILNNGIAPVLNEAQENCVAAVLSQWQHFKISLLHGVTGSGKTEVYIRLIEQALQDQQQTLILVPEIGLSPQLLSRFQSRFRVPIAVYHSDLSDKERLAVWQSAHSGEALIIIGTRSAAFLPLKNPGIFIIDEEHDGSFKQQEGLRYHARDLLIMRAKLENRPIQLGSATPSLESLYNAQQNRYQYLSLPQRAGEARFPSIRVVDIRHKQLEEGLSKPVMLAIQEHLKAKNQILLFLNRRGFSPVLMCLHCRWIAHCKNCDAALTLHYNPYRLSDNDFARERCLSVARFTTETKSLSDRQYNLQCHHCQSHSSIPHVCPECSTTALYPVGLGTERLEAVLNQHFPAHTILRIDRDSTAKKGELQTHFDRVHAGEADLLLGTQMIAKGHHFPNVTLVVILAFDQALLSQDFRSLEKMGQLITQVCGRTGRSHKTGEVILQSEYPDHPLLKVLLEQGYLAFASHLLSERQSLQLPPYSYQALIRAEAKSLQQAMHFLNDCKRQAQKIKTAGLTLSGPIPAVMEKRQGRYRAQLLLQANKRSVLQGLLAVLMPSIQSMPASKQMRWSIDVDPVDCY